MEKLSNHNRLLVGAGTLLMAGSLAIGAEPSAPATEDAAPVEYTIADYSATICPEIPELEMDVIAAAMNGPANPIFEEHEESYQRRSLARRLGRVLPLAESGPDMLRERVDYDRDTKAIENSTRAAVAKDLGLTIHDPQKYMDTVRADVVSGDYEQSFSDYFTAGQAYLAEFGVNLKVRSGPISQKDFTNPSNEQLESDNAKASV